MKEEMIWRNKSYASNVQFVLQIAKSRWIVMLCEFFFGLVLYSSAKEWYGQTAANSVLIYLVFIALICLIGQSLTVARINQAAQLFCCSLSIGVSGGLSISVGVVTSALSKPVPFLLFVGSFFWWLVIAAVVFVILYRKMQRGDFKKRKPAAKTKQIIRLSKTYMGILVMLIGGSSLFLHMAEKSQGGQDFLWLMGIIGGVGFAGMSGVLFIPALAKAKFPSFNIWIPSR